jgi:aspartokinase
VPIKEVNLTGIAAAGKHSKASFVVSTPNIYGWRQIKAALEDKIGSRIEFDTDLAAVSMIGEGLNRNNLLLLEALELLARNAIPVVGITTTSFRISLLVPRGQVDKSVQLCHTRWVADRRQMM